MQKIFISKSQLITSIIFYGTNTIFFIYYLQELFFNLHLLKYLTCLSYYANSIFLLICLICDISIYKNNNSEELENNYQLIDDEKENKNVNKDILWSEKLNNWNRNKYGIICNTFSFFVTISFWILYFLGDEYITVSDTFLGFLSTIYLHLIISILVIIDIAMSKREHSFSWDYFGIISFIFAIYCIMTGINKYNFKSNTYAFMDSSFLFLISYVLLLFFLLYVSYAFNVYLINYKKKKFI